MYDWTALRSTYVLVGREAADTGRFLASALGPSSRGRPGRSSLGVRLVRGSGGRRSRRMASSHLAIDDHGGRDEAMFVGDWVCLRTHNPARSAAEERAVD